MKNPVEGVVEGVVKGVMNGDPSGTELVRIVDAARDLAPRMIPGDPADFLRWLGGPTLIRQVGRDPSRTRIVSTLLHANEPSGLVAVLRWLRNAMVPETNVLFAITSVEAALAGDGFAHRFLPGRVDMNRCWLPPYSGAEARVAHEMLALMRQSGAECLVDIHNNTGHNPPYGVGPLPGAAELNLVALWGDRFIHSPLQLGTLVEATCDDFPSITIECGRSFDPVADEVAYAGLVRLLELPHLEIRRQTAPIRVMTDPVRVSVRSGFELAFGDRPDRDADLTIALDIDRHNFERMPAGTAIGWLRAGSEWPLEALGEQSDDVSRDYFEAADGRLISRRSMIPVMMTTNRDNALADCLFYIVQ